MLFAIRCFLIRTLIGDISVLANVKIRGSTEVAISNTEHDDATLYTSEKSIIYNLYYEQIE